MQEHIYTIPVNEAFEAYDGCPICRLQNKFEADAVDHTLGDAMMQPEIRIVLNRTGFCSDHYKKLSEGKNRLSFALILQSHLAEINANLSKKCTKIMSDMPDDEKVASFLGGIGRTCYVCDKVAMHMDHSMETIFILYNSEEEFRKKLSRQTSFCLPHYQRLMSGVKKSVKKPHQDEIRRAVGDIQSRTIATLSEDIDWFCRKFDYRNINEDWKNSKDIIERLGKFL